MFSPYTMLLGIGLLFLALTALAVPRLLPFGVRVNIPKQSASAPDQSTCGVSDAEMSVRSGFVSLLVRLEQPQRVA